MKKTNSIASLKREEQRNSPKTLAFKIKVNEFLKESKPEIAYAIKRDLACMTNMPFYKDRPKVIRFKMNHIDLICEYAALFKTYQVEEFIIELIKKLSVNQKQIIRKAAPRLGSKKEIWEHAIPTKVIVEELIFMILKKDTTDLCKMLEIYKCAGQRALTKEQDKLLYKYRTSMPENWNWRLKDVNPLARYFEVGILLQ